VLHLRFIYRFYPALRLLPEYRHAAGIVERYGCRRVLDLGCGRGNLFRVLEARGVRVVYVGVDLLFAEPPGSPYALHVVGDARSPPVEVGGFDCALFVNSLFYIGLGVLESLRKPGLLVGVVDIDPSYPHVKLADLLESRLKGMRMTRKALVEHLKQRGFRVLEHGGMATYYVVFTPAGEGEAEA